ncbi:MAG: putative sulfate exporter family transporter [Phycisphaerales bacterium]|nr:putative sulfate exporter family transporter [Phycisphaerales bacterium]
MIGDPETAVPQLYRDFCQRRLKRLYRSGPYRAGAVATLTKLVRVTMLTPMVIVMALVYARRHRGEAGVREKTSIHIGKLIPWYIWGFLVVTVLNTLHLFPVVRFSPGGSMAWWWGVESVSSAKLMAEIGKVLLTLSMVAIGLEVDVRDLIRVGGRAVAVGGFAALILMVVSGEMSYVLLGE